MFDKHVTLMAKSIVSLKAVVPRRVVNTGEVERIITKQLRNTGKDMATDLEKPTRTWKRKVKFLVIVDAKKATVRIFTNSAIYRYTDKGTEPHEITPKRATSLRFNTKFSSKTVPGKLTSRKGSSGPPVAFAKRVMHPGTKPRGWSKIVAKKYKPKLASRINGALAPVIRKKSKRL